MDKSEYDGYIESLKAMDDTGFLKLSESAKSEIYGKKDPLPQIPPALLNSADVLKYVILTGMIDDFHCEDLEGATYTCRVSGECASYNQEKQLCRKTASKDHEIEIKPNSITYVAIKNTFRIPDYIALRFNLRVNHVYKGLLLGTGPIIDPGFAGQIYIPLHNLTSNTYYIKHNAPLISVEFTKLSNNSSWILECGEHQKLIDGFAGFKNKHKEIKANRTLTEYIDIALTDNDFHLPPDTPKYVVSATPDQITETNKKLDKTKEDFVYQKKRIEDALVRISETEGHIKTFTIVTYIVIAVSCAALLSGLIWNTTSFLKETKNLADANASIAVQKEDSDEIRQKYDELFVEHEKLLSRIEALEALSNEVEDGETLD